MELFGSAKQMWLSGLFNVLMVILQNCEENLFTKEYYAYGILTFLLNHRFGPHVAHLGLSHCCLLRYPTLENLPTDILSHGLLWERLWMLEDHRRARARARLWPRGRWRLNRMASWKLLGGGKHNKTGFQRQLN